MKKWHILIGLGILLVYLGIRGSHRHNLLKETGVKGIAQVEKIVDAAAFRRNQTQSAYFNYKVNGVLFTNSTAILNSRIKPGFCYEIVYSASNPAVVEIDFSKELDCSDY